MKLNGGLSPESIRETLLYALVGRNGLDSDVCVDIDRDVERGCEADSISDGRKRALPCGCWLTARLLCWQLRGLRRRVDARLTRCGIGCRERLVNAQNRNVESG